MNKSSNGKKAKVPKLTEAEYAAYIASLKSGEEGALKGAAVALNAENANAKSLES